jgi:hypothetical protein
VRRSSRATACSACCRQSHTKPSIRDMPVDLLSRWSGAVSTAIDSKERLCGACPEGPYRLVGCPLSGVSGPAQGARHRRRGAVGGFWHWGGHVSGSVLASLVWVCYCVCRLSRPSGWIGWRCRCRRGLSAD